MSTLHKKRFDEEIEDYLIRLYSNMNEYGLTKYTIADLMNAVTGDSYDESKWRKDYAHAMKWRDYWFNKNLDQEILQKYEELRIEAEKEKIRKQDQHREYMKLIRNSARFEGIKDEIILSVKDLEKSKPLSPIVNVANGNRKRHGLALASDWHYGMEVDNYKNKFNKEVFIQRVQRWVTKVIEHGKLYNISTLHVGGLGDFISGLIHISTRVQANSDVIQQITYVAEVLAEALTEFSNNFEEVIYYNICGNHGRMIPSKSEVGIKENFENLIPWFLEARLRENKKVKIINEQDGFLTTNILGKEIVLAHGQFDKPENVAYRISQLVGYVPDYVFMGHFHHNYEKEFGKSTVIGNGCLIGNDDHAMQGRYSAPPSQKFIVFDEQEGLIHNAPIWLNIAN